MDHQRYNSEVQWTAEVGANPDANYWLKSFEKCCDILRNAQTMTDDEQDDLMKLAKTIFRRDCEQIKD